MPEKFDIYSKIFYRDVEKFVRHLCLLVLRHQMRVSNYFVNSFYSVQFLNLFFFSFTKFDVMEDVPTLTARIEENLKDAFKCRLSRFVQFLNFFSFSFPKGDDVPTLSARIEEKQKRI